MTAETRHPLAGTKQPCPVCGGMYLVHEWGALEAHNIKRETWWIETCSGAREILPVPEPASVPPAETPKPGLDLTSCLEGMAQSIASLRAMFEHALPTLAAGFAPAPVPSGVDDLRDHIAAAPASGGTDSLALRIAAAIVEAGTGEAMRGVYDTVTIAAAPADLADAVIAVVGPELARRDAEITRLQQCVIGENRAGQINIKTLLGLTEDRARLSTALRDMARRVTEQRRLRRGWMAWSEQQVHALRAERDRLAAEVAELRRFAVGVDTALVPTRDLSGDIPVLDPEIFDEVPAERGEAT